MGTSSDPMAVVDPQLKVYGLKNLRVMDASIMPMVVSGNTNAAVIMIAEKGSDLIKKQWLPNNVNCRCGFGNGNKAVTSIPSPPINNNPNFNNRPKGNYVGNQGPVTPGIAGNPGNNNYRPKDGVYSNGTNHQYGTHWGTQRPVTPGYAGNTVYTTTSGQNSNKGFMTQRPYNPPHRNKGWRGKRSNGYSGSRGPNTTPYEGLYKNDGPIKICDPCENESGGFYYNFNCNNDRNRKASEYRYTSTPPNQRNNRNSMNLEYRQPRHRN